MTKFIKNRKLFFLGLFLFFASGWLFTQIVPFSSQGNKAEIFVVAKSSNFASIADSLKNKGFIKNKFIFDIFWFLTKKPQVQPGGYMLSSNMSIFTIIDILAGRPKLVWVPIEEGLRKEQIAEILANRLNWNQKQKQSWLDATELDPDYREGVYFPDTYLIPADEPPEKVVKRLKSRFENKIKSYQKSLTDKNIKWTTALKIASLIQRESADKTDMPLVSAIIWNRLDKGMRLEIDATVQYARDSLKPDYVRQKGWWTPIKVKDKKLDSLFNTYLYKGLPPTPIANPGLAAIKAAIFPARSDCLFYLHDKNGIIHCSQTYKEHLRNIEDYLK